MAKKPERKVLAPINPPKAGRGDPNIGKKRQRAVGMERIGKALCAKM